MSGIRQVPSGIVGFDALCAGGLPARRVTVVTGGAGTGKTLFGFQFLAAGARAGEAGLLVAFEESPEALRANAASFRWFPTPAELRRIEIFDARLSQTIVQGGEFDLLGLLAMLGARAKQLRATRIVFDGIDVLLDLLGEPALIKREIFRLRDWLLASGLTAIINTKADTRRPGIPFEYSFLEFLADCVVTLEHRLELGTAHRFVRVSKCRGAAHSGNEAPLAITQDGILIGANDTTEIADRVSNTRISSGVARLDVMLGGGFYRGSAVLISGSPGTAKTSLAATAAAAACARGERTVFASFDEGPAQIVRNMRSIGVRLAPYLRSGALRMLSLRARSSNAEAHVARIRLLVDEHRADMLVVDPISALNQAGATSLAEHAALQILDLAKARGVTLVATSLLGNPSPVVEHTQIGISTMADTWMHLAYVSQGGERNRSLTIVKSRGAHHSNQVRELVLGRRGVNLEDVYSVGGEVLFGTLRWQREETERRARRTAETDAEVRQRQAELALAETSSRLAALMHERSIREAELARVTTQRTFEASRAAGEREELLRRRHADRGPAPRRGRR